MTDTTLTVWLKNSESSIKAHRGKSARIEDGNLIIEDDGGRPVCGFAEGVWHSWGFPPAKRPDGAKPEPAMVRLARARETLSSAGISAVSPTFVENAGGGLPPMKVLLGLPPTGQPGECVFLKGVGVRVWNGQRWDKWIEKESE